MIVVFIAALLAGVISGALLLYDQLGKIVWSVRTGREV